MSDTQMNLKFFIQKNLKSSISIKNNKLISSLYNIHKITYKEGGKVSKNHKI